MQKAHVALNRGVVEQINLVEHDEIGLFKLQFQQVNQLFGQVDVGMLGHDHPQALGVDHHHERREGELVGVVVMQRVIHVVERADTAAGDVAHDERSAFLVAQAANLVDCVVHLVADAVVANFRNRAARRLREARINEVCAQVVRYDGSLADVAIHVFRKRDHGRGLAGSQKPLTTIKRILST